MTNNTKAAEASGKVMRGCKIKLYPKPEQAAKLDLWRRRARTLWNLLLGMQQAAYSGKPYRPELGWRRIWAEVAELNYRLASERREVRLADGRATSAEAKPPQLDKILARNGGDDAPKLFIWETDCQKLMARLKAVPLTGWIGELPSHAAQHVVKDLIKALQAMLRERGKRAAGKPGRDTGFPKFKANRYAAGSIYFANTQIAFDWDRRRIRFPAGLKTIKYKGAENIPAGAKLMGARAWRQGEEWWLSAQFEMAAPPPLAKTGREAGVKIAAAIILTTVDSQGRSRQVDTPKQDKRRVRRIKLAGRKLARCLAAQKAKEEKIAARTARRKPSVARLPSGAARSAPPEGKGTAAGRVRIGRSQGFYAASARLAKLHAEERNTRDDLLHKETSRIVARYDTITVQEMDVAAMMKKPQKHEKRLRRRERRLEEGAAPPKRRNLKVMRKVNRRAAMARCRTLLTYKAHDGGRVLNITHALMPIVQECSQCGALHPEMQDGRPVLRCLATLPDGTVCDAVLERRKNAAANELRHGRTNREASEKLDA